MAGTLEDQLAGQTDIEGGEVAEPVLPLEEIKVGGSSQLSMFDMGGKRPQSATIRLQGGQYELLQGEAYRKGDFVHFEGVARVVEVGQRDKVDAKTGQPISASQKHIALIQDLQIRPIDKV